MTRTAISWALEQAALLRAGRLDQIDIENIAEEIESLGKSFANELRSRYGTLVMHLLKWQFQPEAAVQQLDRHGPARAPGDRQAPARTIRD